ncbi:MAG: S9 family peptidase [Actinobacteria bacterium]|nr:S9 family peptidase [Actinomycetota bacterium]
MTEPGTYSPTLIPREVLFGNPEKAQPRLSPDGERLAYLAPVDGVLNVWVGPVSSTVGGEDYRPVTRDRLRGIRIYFWAEDNEHIVYLQDVGGNEDWRIHATDPRTQETRDLTPFEGVQAQLLAKNKRFPDTLLVGLNKENPQVHDVYRLSISSGDLELVAKNPGNVASWVADRDFRVRGAAAATPEGGFDLLFRETEEADWRTLVSWGPEDALNSGPVSFSGDGERMYLLDSRGANAARLVALDLESEALEVLARDERYDVGDVLMHPDTYEVQAVAIERGRTEWTVLDESIRADFEAMERLDRGDFAVTSRDRADENWLVAFTADDRGSYYYSYDRTEREEAYLFDARSELSGYALARMEPVSFTARDGLEIEGYLTRPPGSNFSAELPMVLDVHGGPWARDGWGYNPEAQWLANRGYACLQVNYRGSTGYGKRFLNAGNKEWGAAMHDDLVDAVNWAIGEGIADPERVVGPSNLVTLIESIPPYWSTFLATFYERVGNPETEREFLESRSPLFFVDRIQVPILIAQGANDPRVKQAESEQIVAAMKEKSIDYEYLLFEDEGHGFARPENRLKFYAAAERFLAKHLGGRAED